uniref:AMMECR1 domain-containing protein n=1 Tax=Glycine max TaxID=3847 RepID=C6SW54_SOYBN|nr:unknown [Glycine max]
MVSANKEMVVHCFDTLLAHYNSTEAPPPAFDQAQHPLFVTWKKVVNGGDPRLRGGIGTLEARSLINGLKDYALTNALRDRRFPPIQVNELPLLECTVSLLTDYETANHYLDWEIEKHGIIIEFSDPVYNTRCSATYLPEVAVNEGWTKTEAVDSLIRKAGYNGPITDELRMQIQLTRYQSTLFTMHYSEYVSYVKERRGEAPILAAKSPNY